DDLLAVRQHDDEPALVVVRPEELHRVQVHDVRSVDLDEGLGIQPPDQLAQAEVKKKRTSGRVDLGVVALRLDAENSGGWNRDDSLSAPREETPERRVGERRAGSLGKSPAGGSSPVETCGVVTPKTWRAFA